MVTDDPAPHHTDREYCDECGTRTEHDVSIEIRAEASPANSNAAFSREPYRVATCRRCGAERASRMNNA